MLNSTSQKQPGVTGSVNSQETQGKILAILSTIDTTFLGYRTEIHKFRLCFINSQVYNVSWHQKETKQNNEIPINILVNVRIRLKMNANRYLKAMLWFILIYVH